VAGLPRGVEDRHEPTQHDLQPPGGERQGTPVPDRANAGLGPVAVAGQPGDLQQVLGQVAGITLEPVLGPFAGDPLTPDDLEPGRGDGRLHGWLVHARRRVPKPLDQQRPVGGSQLVGGEHRMQHHPATGPHHPGALAKHPPGVLDT
jgi:hypothetical protein